MPPTPPLMTFAAKVTPVMRLPVMVLFPGSVVWPRSVKELVNTMPVKFDDTTLFRSLKNGARIPVSLLNTVDPVIVMLALGLASARRCRCCSPGTESRSR